MPDRVAITKGLPTYMKVIDASVQDSNPDLDFTLNPLTKERGIRIQEEQAHHAVESGQYANAAQTKVETENRQLAEENARLKAQLAALKGEVTPIDEGGGSNPGLTNAEIQRRDVARIDVDAEDIIAAGAAKADQLAAANPPAPGLNNETLTEAERRAIAAKEAEEKQGATGIKTEPNKPILTPSAGSAGDKKPEEKKK